MGSGLKDLSTAVAKAYFTSQDPLTCSYVGHIGLEILYLDDVTTEYITSSSSHPALPSLLSLSCCGVDSDVLFLDTPLGSFSTSQAKTALESNGCSSTCGSGPVFAQGEAPTHPPQFLTQGSKGVGGCPMAGCPMHRFLCT